jgi:glutathione S-transferase
MKLVLYFHPLASFCHKVLMALYENETPFTGHIVDLMDADSRAQFIDVWPLGKFPVLRDESLGRTIPETSIIIEYLDQHYPGAHRLLPASGIASSISTCRFRCRRSSPIICAPMASVIRAVSPTRERH